MEGGEEQRLRQQGDCAVCWQVMQGDGSDQCHTGEGRYGSLWRTVNMGWVSWGVVCSLLLSSGCL